MWVKHQRRDRTVLNFERDSRRRGVGFSYVSTKRSPSIQLGSDNAHWYVSSTEYRDNRANVYGTNFTDGDDDWDHKDNNDWSLRPFVAELGSPFSILILDEWFDFGAIWIRL